MIQPADLLKRAAPAAPEPAAAETRPVSAPDATPAAGELSLVVHCTWPEALANLAAYLAPMSTIGVDLETTGLDPLRDCVRVLTLAARTTIPERDNVPVLASFVVDTWDYPGWP